jgi:hypothetical protein
MERRLGIMQSVEPVLENAIKTLQKVVDVRGMGKALVQIDEPENMPNSENQLLLNELMSSLDDAAAAKEEAPAADAAKGDGAKEAAKEEAPAADAAKGDAAKEAPVSKPK